MGSHGGRYSQVLLPKPNSQIDRPDPGVLLRALVEFPLGAEIGAKTVRDENFDKTFGPGSQQSI